MAKRAKAAADDFAGLDTTTMSDDEKAYIASEQADDPVAGAEAPETPEAAPEGQKPAQEPAKPEEGQKPDKAADPAQDQQKTVPHGAFHEERERRKQAEERARQTELRAAQLEGRLNQLAQAFQPKQEQPAQPPNPDTDPFGYIKWAASQIQTQQQQLDGFNQAQHWQKVEQQALQSFSFDAAQTTQEVEGYQEATNYLERMRAAELQALGMEPAMIPQQIAQDLKQFIYNAITNRRRPAMALYELAKVRGWQAQVPQAPVTAQVQNMQPATPVQPQAQNRDLNGQFAPGSRPDPAAKLANIAKGQAAHKSLSGSGATPGPGIDIKAIANMSDDEFSQWMRTATEAQKQAVLT